MADKETGDVRIVIENSPVKVGITAHIENGEYKGSLFGTVTEEGRTPSAQIYERPWGFELENYDGWYRDVVTDILQEMKKKIRRTYGYVWEEKPAEPEEVNITEEEQ